jgi:hypothetical protein
MAVATAPVVSMVRLIGSIISASLDPLVDSLALGLFLIAGF